MDLPFKLYPQEPISGDKLMIIYNRGILLDGLKKDIYLQFGFGRDDLIEKIYECKMIRKNSEYLMVIPTLINGFLYLAFKDSFGNKDDNNGSFYKVLIKSKE
ncbi:hypothetical protein ELD05_07615 [Caldicellulosiruptor changbaiensis]|uniref:Uncharacterized protein n=2 Tax=Caldicellulosiruptor TaxID=44000 RepID=A4XK94_CALS8|nr:MULTISPECIES: hypothetical protein [Caldicellulosiruptor]ABP67329.1 hypothetical protein Csac_1742 [Caldicellulosiruptor saccharolyticus DSM 8903]AZT90523.1 hypothetical protein ELD05_07615 [Caldicellulosiruptor changbaiensis]